MGHAMQSQPNNNHDALGTEANAPIDEPGKRTLIEEKESFNQSATSIEGIIIYEKVKILEANQTLATMFGYELSEIIGMTILELITPDSRGLILKNVLLKQEKNCEAIGLKKDGTAFSIQLQNKTILYKQQPVRALTVSKITERGPEEVLKELQRLKSELEEEIKHNTTELRFANERLREELEERERMEAEIIERNRELLTLQSAGAAITSSLDLQHVLNTVTKEMTKLLEVEVCAIFEWDHAAGTISLLSEHGRDRGQDEEALGKVSSLIDYPLKKQVLLERYSQQMTINQPGIAPTEMAYMQEANIKTLLLLPMIFQERVVGLLEIMDRRERNFMRHQIALAQLLANQAASAIENAWLYAETQRRAEQLKDLRELDRAITTSLRLSDVFYALAQHAIRLLPYHHMSITLQEGDAMRVTYVAGNNKDKTALSTGTLIPHQNSIIGWVVERNQPSLRHNIASGPRFVENEQLAAGGIRSTIIVPLRIKGRVIGAWNIGNAEVGAYNPDDVDIAQSIADQLAPAIENARLYQQARQEITERKRAETALEKERALLAQRVEERTTELKQQYRRQAILAEIELAVNQPRELQNLLDYIAQITKQTLQASGGASVVLWNADKETFSIFSTTIPNQNVEKIVKRIRRKGGATRWIIDNRQTLAIPNASQTPFSPNPMLSEFGHNAYAGVPLLAKEEVLGVLYLFDLEQRLYTEEDLDFMLAVANRAAVAITKVRLYEKLEQANAELTRAVRIKDDFVAAMSHELRTPLTAILGMSEILRGGGFGPLTEKQIKSVTTIEESGRHLLELINDILDLSKIEAGKLDFQIGPVSIKEVCKDSLEFVKQAANKKQLTVSSNYNIAITLLQTDERRLKQILVNLLINAAKFTPEGGEIGLEVVSDATNKMIQFTVWDTGIGIAPEDMDRLFQPFVQLDSRLARQYEGTGLGLAIVQRMAQIQGGNVSVESTVGQGSRFTVSLPWLEVTTKADQLAEKTKAAQAASQKTDTLAKTTTTPASDHNKPPDATSPSPPLILVAEDDKAVLGLLSDYLANNGYQVAQALNGVEALNQANIKKPDLILMDIQMPEMNGLEAIRHLRADANLTATPIIALTAMAMPGDRERCLEAGADDYVSKPLRLKNLIKMIQTQLK